MKLINKDAVVAELYRLRDFVNDRWDIEEMNGVDKFLDKLIPFINSIEVKEIDFETAFAASIDHFDAKNNYGRWSESDLRQFAKHFFELGIALSNKAQKK